MVDLSTYSDAELMAIAGSSGPDMSSLSDADLMMAAGISAPMSQTEQIQAAAPTIAPLASGWLSGVAGLGDLTSMVGDVFSGQYTKRKIGESLGVQQEQPASLGDMLRSGIDAATGVEGSTGIGDDTLAYKFGSYLPSSLMGPGSIASKLALNATASGGGYLGNEVGGPVGEVVGSILGTAAPSVLASVAKSAVRPFSRAGQEVMAGQELLANAGAQGRTNLEKLLTGAAPEGQFGPLTYAELADSPSAAAFQTAIRKVPGEGANAIEDALLQRELGQKAALQQVAPTSLSGVPTSIRGDVLQRTAADIIEEQMKKAGDPYDAINQNLPINIAKERYATGATRSAITKGSALTLDSNAKAVIDKFIDSPSKTIGDLNKLNKQAGQVMGQIARINPQADEVKLMATVRTQIESALQRAMKTGQIDPTDKLAIEGARDHFKNVASTFRTPALKNLTKKGDYGQGFRMKPETALKNAISDPKTAEDVRKAFGGNAEIMGNARAGLVDDMAQKPITSWPKYYADKEKGQIFSNLFWKNNSNVKQVMEDISSLNKVGEMATKASKGQSATGQFTTVAKTMLEQGPRAFLKVLNKVGSTGSGAGTFVLSGGNIGATLSAAALSKAATWAENNISLLTAKAIADPDLLAELVKKGTQANQANVAKKLVPLIIKTMGASGASIAGNEGRKDEPVADAVTKAEEKIAMKTLEAPEVVSVERKPETKDKVKRIEAKIDADPIDSTIYEMESSRNPLAKNPDSTASGAFQLLKKTASSLGVKDVFDIEQNYQGYRKIRESEYDKLADKPEDVYAVHYLGQPTYKRWKAGKDLTPAQSAQVKYLESKLLPKFRRIYAKKVKASTGQVEA